MRKSNPQCHFCRRSVRRPQWHHHPIEKNAGGVATVPVHRSCHRRHHKSQFVEWGRIGGIISSQRRHWANYLLNVKENAARYISASYVLRRNRKASPVMAAMAAATSLPLELRPVFGLHEANGGDGHGRSGSPVARSASPNGCTRTCATEDAMRIAALKIISIQAARKRAANA